MQKRSDYTPNILWYRDRNSSSRWPCIVINLVFICDPESYLREDNDIPMTYRAAARDPRIRLFHLPTHGVTGHDTIEVAPVPHGPLSRSASA